LSGACRQFEQAGPFQGGGFFAARPFLRGAARGKPRGGGGRLGHINPAPVFLGWEPHRGFAGDGTRSIIRGSFSKGAHPGAKIFWQQGALNLSRGKVGGPGPGQFFHSSGKKKP